MFDTCFRCGSPKGSITLTFGKTRRIVCEDCRWTPKRGAAVRRNKYRMAIKTAVPDISWLDEAARVREDLAVVAPRGPTT